jgi:DNA-binding MarR family transcriptional regulator
LLETEKRADAMLELISHIVNNAQKLEGCIKGQKNKYAIAESRVHHFHLSEENHEIALAVTAENIIKFRKERNKIFSEDGLFSDPGWDILLDLFVAHHKRINISVTSACIASQVAPTTALRWINALEHHGLIKRRSDPLDARRAFLTLTEDAIKKITQTLANCSFLYKKHESDHSFMLPK